MYKIHFRVVLLWPSLMPFFSALCENLKKYPLFYFKFGQGRVFQIMYIYCDVCSFCQRSKAWNYRNSTSYLCLYECKNYNKPFLKLISISFQSSWNLFLSILQFFHLNDVIIVKMWASGQSSSSRVDDPVPNYCARDPDIS